MIKQLITERQHFDGLDPIFTLNAAAQARAATGEAVINATVGALLDDKGKLVVLKTVMEQYALLQPMEIAPYAPIAGDPAYLLAMTRRQWPRLDSYGVGVATPGGTGALAVSIRNLLQRGDTLLTVSPYWGPYNTLASENGVLLESVKYPPAAGRFDAAAWRAKFEEILRKQGRLLFWLNDPCHNPTGRSLSAEDRQELIGILRDVSSLGSVTLLLDLAYLEYTRDPAHVRAALDDYAELGAEGNVLVGAALSLSKAYTLYGARAGALVFPWTHDAAFQAALATSCRGSFSNCARAPMSVLLRMSRDDAAAQRLADEHAHWSATLAERADAVNAALAAQGVETSPWLGGFFLTIETADAIGVCNRLQEHGVFVVPMPEGLRVGVCGIKTEDAPRFAAAVRLCLPGTAA